MALCLPDGEFHAYLFDCEGTIADSMPLHYVASQNALAAWNCSFSEDLFYAWAGFAVAKILSLLNEKHGLKMPVEDVARRKEELYLELLANPRAVPRGSRAGSLAIWPDSFGCRLGKHARIGEHVASFVAPAR